MEVLGGPVDFVLHSIGMSPNVRKKRTYDDLDYDMLEKDAGYFRCLFPQDDTSCQEAQRHCRLRFNSWL